LTNTSDLFKKGITLSDFSGALAEIKALNCHGYSSCSYRHGLSLYGVSVSVNSAAILLVIEFKDSKPVLHNFYFTTKPYSYWKWWDLV